MRLRWGAGLPDAQVGREAGVRDGKITEYHVNVKLAFVVEGSEIEKP